MRLNRKRKTSGEEIYVGCTVAGREVVLLSATRRSNILAHPSTSQGSVNVHYRPSITHSLLIHLLTLRHARTHARSAHANADTP